jgi:hypothetical protein
MSNHDRSLITQPLKPYRLYRLGLNDDLLVFIAEADTHDELWRVHKRRPHWKYAVFHGENRLGVARGN